MSIGWYSSISSASKFKHYYLYIYIYTCINCRNFFIIDDVSLFCRFKILSWHQDIMGYLVTVTEHPGKLPYGDTISQDLSSLSRVDLDMGSTLSTFVVYLRTKTQTICFAKNKKDSHRKWCNNFLLNEGLFYYRNAKKESDLQLSIVVSLVTEVQKSIFLFMPHSYFRHWTILTTTDG